MNDRAFSSNLLSWFVAFAAAWSIAAASRGASLPPGAAEFAGRLARNYPYLLEAKQRETIEGLNRELRRSQEAIRRGGSEQERRAAMERAAAASRRLPELVKSSAQLIRIDLTSGRPVVAGGGKRELPGSTGALLLEIAGGGEGLAYGSVISDLSQPLGESSVIPLEIGASGTTYVLAGLERLPTGRTTLELELRAAGRGPVRVPIDVNTPAPGRLKLTVLSDDTGEAAPAMVRLVWRMDGQTRQPGNGIEFAPQFDRQGRPSGARNANLPGSLGETFWCIPGPVDMTLEPGEWRIGVRRGVEHEVIYRDVTIGSGKTVEQTFRPKRWTDLRKAGWWSGDDHVHCRILSDQDARNLMAWVQAEDIHLANVVKMGDIYRTYFEQRGFGAASRVIDGEYILSPGQECPRTHDQIGHTLAMNITTMVRDTDRYYLYDETFDAVHAQGGLTGYAHVESDNFHVHRDMSLNVPRQKVDFAEILQFNHLGTDLYYEFLNLGCKLTASAGSDVPWGGTVGEVRVYAYLGSEKFTADAWFAAFRRGRTFTTSGPMIEFAVDGALPGDELKVAADRKLRVRARAWGEAQRMGPIKLEIVRHGEVIRSAQAEGKGAEVAVDFAVDAGHGCWLAARASAGDGTSAHTTPVYVVREGLRFWKHEGISALIDKRLGNLGEIEGLIAEARRLNGEGKLEGDRYRKQLALQGDLLMQRIAAARGMYAELKRTADAERKAREAK